MDQITIAITVSRVAAVVVASMLEGYGIPVHIGGYAQASVEFNSLALGGFRLWVSEADWPTASDILRQSAADAPDSPSTGPRRALLRSWGGVLAIYAAMLLPAMALGMARLEPFLLPLELMVAPVNPQGRADYYLAPPAAE